MNKSSKYLIFALAIFIFTVEVFASDENNNPQINIITSSGCASEIKQNVDPHVQVFNTKCISKIKQSNSDDETTPRPFFRIYTDGVVKQSKSLSLENWQAIELAVDYALVNAQAALSGLKMKKFGEASSDVNTAIHWLTLVKMAIPEYVVYEKIDNVIHKKVEQSYYVVTQDARGRVRLVDVPLLMAFLTNAKMSLELHLLNDSLLFLTNTQYSILYEE
jgi:hypothetical protein